MTRDAIALESRRVAAAAELAAGARQADIARKYGISRTSASRWARLKTTKATKATGRPVRIPWDELRRLYRAYAEDTWTGTAFGRAIFNNFAVQFSKDHCGRLLARLREEKKHDG